MLVIVLMTVIQDTLVQELDVLDVEDIADKPEKLLFLYGIVVLRGV